MSTPSPQRITLPAGRAFNVVINSPDYPINYPGELTFSQDKVSSEWTAAYSVPSVMLTELNCPVTQTGQKVEFGFTLRRVTDDQKKAGYVSGPYTFSFVPPGSGASEFTGQVNDPRPGQTEDTFTARGNEGDPKNISGSC